MSAIAGVSGVTGGLTRTGVRAGGRLTSRQTVAALLTLTAVTGLVDAVSHAANPAPAASAAGPLRRAGPPYWSRMRSRCGSYSGAICSRAGRSPAGVRTRKSPSFSHPPVTPSGQDTWASPTGPPTV